jgi:hypothetical protein
MGRRKDIPNVVKLPDERHGPVWMDGSNNEYEEVRDAFIGALRVFFPKIDYRKPTYGTQAYEQYKDMVCIPDIKEFYGTGFMPTYHQMTPEQQEAANRLYIVIGHAIWAAYNHGQDNGRNLLLGLAKGEVSFEDYNQGVRLKREEE